MRLNHTFLNKLYPVQPKACFCNSLNVVLENIKGATMVLECVTVQQWYLNIKTAAVQLWYLNM